MFQVLVQDLVLFSLHMVVQIDHFLNFQNVNHLFLNLILIFVDLDLKERKSVSGPEIGDTYTVFKNDTFKSTIQSVKRGR